MPVTRTSVIVATATASWITPESVTRQRARSTVFRLICDGLVTAGEPTARGQCPPACALVALGSRAAALRCPGRNGELGQAGLRGRTDAPPTRRT